MSEQDELERWNDGLAERVAHDDAMWVKCAEETKALGCPRCNGEERYGWICPKCAYDLIGWVLKEHAEVESLRAQLDESQRKMRHLREMLERLLTRIG